MADISRLTVTIMHKPAESEGPPWCWSTEYGHGQAVSPNAAVAAAMTNRAEVLVAAEESSRQQAEKYEQEAGEFMKAARAAAG